MSDYKNTNVDNGKLFAFTIEQKEKGADINEKMSLQPLTLKDGSYTVLELNSFTTKAADHYQSLVDGNSMSAADYSSSKASKMDPSEDPPSSSDLGFQNGGNMPYLSR